MTGTFYYIYQKYVLKLGRLSFLFKIRKEQMVTKMEKELTLREKICQSVIVKADPEEHIKNSAVLRIL